MAEPTAIDQLFAFFAVVHDLRRQHPTTLHTLETILTVTILATLCGEQHWVKIEHWGHAKAEWLVEFLDLAHKMACMVGQPWSGAACRCSVSKPQGEPEHSPNSLCPS